jgi:hypothetical protein
MRRTAIRTAAARATAASIAACSDSGGPSTGGQVNFNLATKAASTPSAAAQSLSLATVCDFNHDGVSDAEDTAIESTLAIWRQENLGDPFVRLSSVLSSDLDEVEAGLTGFSRYALAY